MELFSQRIKRSELKEGDHVYTWRKQVYNHHGIFIGQGKIIHFVNPQKDGKLGLSASSSDDVDYFMKTPCPISYCGSEKVAGSGVRMTCIDCFIKNGSLYRYKYQAHREFVRVKLIRGGTCTTKMSDPPEEVIRRATYLHENGYEEYNLFNNNCEDFALYCKTGLVSHDISHQGRSSQANRLLPTKVEDGIRRLTKPYKTDLGIREDVVKVPVEMLASFLATLKLNKLK